MKRLPWQSNLLPQYIKPQQIIWYETNVFPRPMTSCHTTAVFIAAMFIAGFELFCYENFIQQFNLRHYDRKCDQRSRTSLMWLFYVTKKHKYDMIIILNCYETVRLLNTLRYALAYRNNIFSSKHLEYAECKA